MRSWRRRDIDRAFAPGYEGFVYFIQAESGGPVKIGWSLTPVERRGQIQYGNPEVLRIIGLIEGSRDKEAEMHVRFAQSHVRGEWFADTGDLMRLIREEGQEWMP